MGEGVNGYRKIPYPSRYPNESIKLPSTSTTNYVTQPLPPTKEEGDFVVAI
jgi:hypothetical protein